jgi:hypothetical protein
MQLLNKEIRALEGRKARRVTEGKRWHEFAESEMRRARRKVLLRLPYLLLKDKALKILGKKGIDANAEVATIMPSIEDLAQKYVDKLKRDREANS